MLVLSRRIGEEIVIGEAIRLVVIDVQGRRVRLGISAPPSVRIDRKEILALPATDSFSWSSNDECAES
jgi:carbon storage regulator